MFGLRDDDFCVSNEESFVEFTRHHVFNPCGTNDVFFGPVCWLLVEVAFRLLVLWMFINQRHYRFGILNNTP